MLIFGRVKVFENGFVVDTFDENNETSWPSWKDVWCATFGNRRLGRPSSRGGAGCRRPYPLSTSQSHIQIYILTLRLPPQHSSFLKCQDQPDNTTTCTSFPLPDSAQYLPRFHLPACRSTHKLASSYWFTADDTCMQFNQASPYW